MTYRTRHLANNETQSSDNSTYSLELPETGALHALFVTVDATNGATGGHDEGPLTIADEVRVVGDGDERFFYLTPNEIEKWYETEMGLPLQMEHDEAAAAVQHVVLPIKFGRWYYDPEYFLPLDRIKNPRLEIPYSPNIAADGGFATGTTRFNVVGIWSPPTDPLSYQGTLVTRTIKSFTSLASGDDICPIDITDPIRAIGIYAYEEAVEDGTDITRVRLEANNGEFDLWQGDWKDFVDFNRSHFWSRIIHNFKAFIQDNDTLLTRLGNIKQFSVEHTVAMVDAADTFSLFNIDAISGDRLTFGAMDADITAGAETFATRATDSDVYVSVEGDSPSYFGLIPYMWPDMAQNYLKPNDYSKLRVVLTQGGAGAAVRISLQFLKQLRG